MSASTTIFYARRVITQTKGTIQNFVNYNAKYDLYVHSETIAWDYTQKRPYIGDTITEGKRMYLHLYYNPSKAVEDERNFNVMMLGLETELKPGRRNPEHEKLYEKYFEVRTTSVRGTTVTPKQEAMDEARCRHGYSVLLSNEVKDPVAALELYRNRDVVKKTFGNIKERLNC